MTDQIKHATLQEWIEALESGKYQQHRKELTPNSIPIESTDTLCCLGVYCKISGYTGNSADLPYFAIVDENVEVRVADCIIWNDYDDLTFPEIAQKLRERYLNRGTQNATL